MYPGKYVPEVLLKLIATEKATFSHCVPSILNMLLTNPAAASCDLGRWKVLAGGAALPRSVALAALARGIDVSVGYGLSESCPILTPSLLGAEELKLPLEQQADLRCRSVRPIAMVQLKILNGDGNEVSRDNRSAGEIVVRAPGSPRDT